MNWLEVSMTVNGELAEAVADVLARFAPNGVTTEQAVDFVNDEDEGTPVGPITVRAYLPADEKLEENASETGRVALLSGHDPAAASAGLHPAGRPELDGSLEGTLQANPDWQEAHHRPGLARVAGG